MNLNFKELYEQIKPIRNTVSIINDDCLVITYSELIQEAFAFFGNKIKSFFILDKFTSELDDIDFNGLDAYGKDDSDYLLKADRRYCYVQPRWDFWQAHGFWPMMFELEKYKKNFEVCIPSVIIDPIRPSFFGRKGNATYIERRFAEIEKIYTSLADEESKKSYVGIVKALATGDPGYIPLSHFPQYKHPNCSPEIGDVVIDGGLETAETPLMFADIVKEAGEVIGFEPVPEQVTNCRNDVKNRDNITIIEQGLSSTKSHFFIHGGGAGSFLSREGFDGAVECTTTDIDSWCIENSKCPTLLKLDVEGSEQSTLRGSKFILDSYQPKLMISLYHSIDDYIDIPLFFINHYPEYSLYIGHHSPWWNETILYGKPKQKMAYQHHVSSQMSFIERNQLSMLMNTAFEKLNALEMQNIEMVKLCRQIENRINSLAPLLSDNNEISKDIYTCLLSTQYEHMPFYRFLWRKIKSKF